MPDPPKKALPKGGRKGGTTFPRLSLNEVLTYATKLVTKTHVGPQSKSVVFKGVFDNSGPIGGVRASALRQFGLLEVDDKGYRASQLAKDIGAAPENEKAPLFRKACVAPALFKTLYETFHGDEVSKPKIRQQALNLNVHPEFVDTCVDIFVVSLETAALATLDGDKVTIVPLSAISQLDTSSEESDDRAEQAADSNDKDPQEEQPANGDASNQLAKQEHSRPRATIQVNVTLGSSLDTDKLKKQLALLRNPAVQDRTDLRHAVLNQNGF